MVFIDSLAFTANNLIAERFQENVFEHTQFCEVGLTSVKFCLDLLTHFSENKKWSLLTVLLPLGIRDFLQIRKCCFLNKISLYEQRHRSENYWYPALHFTYFCREAYCAIQKMLFSYSHAFTANMREFKDSKMVFLDSVCFSCEYTSFQRLGNVVFEENNPLSGVNFEMQVWSFLDCCCLKIHGVKDRKQFLLTHMLSLQTFESSKIQR